ncbi:universal stress protein [Halospeciosus flavus]|uniref:Universal stress protein n=1 Tax=Halospeciosus flavus TaxID=3032283 RepID=A0ABD5Z6S5_9EURY|nr:universal stress protein [Halospeciosus flavus]
MKVLLGIGGTDDSLDALEKTIARAKEAGDDLTVAVLENPESDRTPEEVEAAVEAAFDAADFEATVRHLSGDPGSSLVELAEREEFEQIALGGGERSPMGKIRLGPVSEFVLLNSHVSVKLVR